MVLRSVQILVKVKFGTSHVGPMKCVRAGFGAILWQGKVLTI